MNALERAIKVVGSQSELARRLGVKQQHVWSWLHKTKRVPAEQAIPIEKATGVSRHDLRPDLYPKDDAA